MLFLFFALFGPIILRASVNGIFSPVGLTATERAAKITSAGIPGMGEK